MFPDSTDQQREVVWLVLTKGCDRKVAGSSPALAVHQREVNQNHHLAVFRFYGTKTDTSKITGFNTIG